MSSFTRLNFTCSGLKLHVPYSQTYKATFFKESHPLYLLDPSTEPRHCTPFSTPFNNITRIDSPTLKIHKSPSEHLMHCNQGLLHNNLTPIVRNSLIGSWWINGPIIKLLTLADLEGVCPGQPPPRVQILSFRHTKFLKRNRLRSPRPPTRSYDPPLPYIWGEPWDTFVSFLQMEKCISFPIFVSILCRIKTTINDK